VSDDLSFVVVGSPRAGTTLVQRLACELPGVGMPPETHFLEYVVPQLAAGAAPEQAVRSWLAEPAVRGLEVDVTALLGRNRSPGEMFGALVRQLCPEQHVRGEKTPAHGAWWRPLSRWSPTLRFVCVVRDPRAVVRSNLESPWAQEAGSGWGAAADLAVAERWRDRQLDVLDLRRALPERTLLLRYEEVAADPELTRQRLARFLDVPDAATQAAAPMAGIVQSWETWKQSALGPVTRDRIDAWRTELAPERAALVAAVCAGPLRTLGYPDAPGPARAAARLARLPWPQLRSLRGLRRGLTARRQWVGGMTL
jgi:hypothetical protein